MLRTCACSVMLSGEFVEVQITYRNQEKREGDDPHEPIVMWINKT